MTTSVNNINQPRKSEALRDTILLVILFVTSIISGRLMAKASWISRFGMTLFFREYNFLKVWWQGTIAVFIVLLLVFSCHQVIRRKQPRRNAITLYLLLMIVAVAGWYFTYLDFKNVFAHRITGSRFHYGFYFFWAGWIATNIFFLVGALRSPSKLAQIQRPSGNGS